MTPFGPAEMHTPSWFLSLSPVTSTLAVPEVIPLRQSQSTLLLPGELATNRPVNAQ